MQKIPTLFLKDLNNLALVTAEPNPLCQWVFDGDGVATRKFDGTAAAIIDGILYKRYDVKKGRQVPLNAIPCQDPDSITGHWPHWVRVNSSNKEDKYFYEALIKQFPLKNGTYELCGPKVNGNHEGLSEHELIEHGGERYISPLSMLTYENLKLFLTNENIEGIVFHHKTDGRMCKIRKSDFGIKR